MNLVRKAVCAAAVIAANLILAGCGSNFRPIATPLPVNGGDTTGLETVAVLNQCPDTSCTDFEGRQMLSNVTAINISGDTNMGNKALEVRVGQAPGAGLIPTPLIAGTAPASVGPVAWDSFRNSIYTANTTNDTVSQLLLNPSTGTFLTSTNTMTLPSGAAPIDWSFQYFNTNQTQDYVVDQGSPIAAWGPCAAGEGGLSVITQATATVKTTVCLGAGSAPVAAWIFHDQSKVFVADYAKNQIYIVSASTYKVTHTISLTHGVHPFKFAQSNDGQFVYVLNQNGYITIIDGQAETATDQLINNKPLTSAQAIDIAQSTNFSDASTNTQTSNTALNSQANHVWILHADGSVSVWDASTVPQGGQLGWITSIATGANPTNLVLLPDGSWAYVGLGGTNQIVAINTSVLSSGVVTQGVTSNIGLDVLIGGIDRSKVVTQTLTDTSGAPHTVPVEVTTPVVSSVGTSPQAASSTTAGASALLVKAYATTRSVTTYYCYNADVQPTDCSNADPWSGTASFLQNKAGVPVCTNNPSLFSMTCNDLYNGTAVVAAAGQGPTSGVIFTLSAAADASSGTTVYTGTITGGGSNAFRGLTFTVAGFTTLANNGTFECTASSTTTLTLANASGVAETHAGTATEGPIPVNTQITTIPTPSMVTYCDPGNPVVGNYDGQKNCPAMIPVFVLGRS